MTDSLDHLAGQLEALDGEPVSAHPRVLDDLHRGLLSELDRLAGIVAGDGPRQTHATG